MSRTVFLRIVLSLACASSGCSYGMTAAKYPPATGPRGVGVTLRVATGQVSGELLEVRESGLMILTVSDPALPAISAMAGDVTSRKPDQGRVLFVVYDEILSSKLDRTSSSLAVRNRQTPDGRIRERLRLLSRFPQGLADDLLRRLLSAHGQTELSRAAS